MATYKADTAFIKALRVTQRNWIAFRDSELKMKYPNREPGWYGTIHSICHYGYLQELTEQQIEKLREWLVETEEGDLCSGSVKISN